MSISRRDCLKAVGVGAVSLAMTSETCVSASPAAAPAGVGGDAGARGKPNIVFILTDDQGYGDLSSYGAKDLKTPSIDALMSAGMRFDSFYANCPVCSPTRAAAMTGRFPDLVGVPGVIRTVAKHSWGHLSPEAVLLPTVLGKAGYHTAIIGKWHLGLESPNTPTERGFDHFHGFLGDMMEDYYTHRRSGHNYMRLDCEEIDPKGHATDLFTEWSVEYVRGRAGKAEPFFLYLSYNAPHTPIQPPSHWLARVKKRQPGIGEKRAKLVALIEHLDDGIGKVIAALKASGQAGNTLVVFSSDNGGQGNVGANNGGLHGAKQDMWEGGIRVPTCAVWPGRIKPGSRSDRVVMTMDLFPTFCAAAGADVPHKIEGRSVLPTLLGEEQPVEDRFLFWPRLEGGRYGGQTYYAARHGDWKLLQNRSDDPLKLFNLKTDPQETKPLGPEHPEYVRLAAALRKHIAAAKKVPWRKDAN